METRELTLEIANIKLRMDKFEQEQRSITEKMNSIGNDVTEIKTLLKEGKKTEDLKNNIVQSGIEKKIGDEKHKIQEELTVMINQRTHSIDVMDEKLKMNTNRIKRLEGAIISCAVLILTAVGTAILNLVMQ